MRNSGRKTVKVATQDTAGKVSKAGKTNGVGRVDQRAEVVSAGVEEARSSLPTHEEIAQRSYALYLARGGVHGHDVEDWLRAESDLLA